MKKMRRVLAMLLVLVTVLALAPVSAFAATTYITVTPGKAYALKTEYSSQKDANGNLIEKNHYYKLTVQKDSLVQFQWTGNDRNGAYVEIFADSARKTRVCGLSTLYGKASGVENVVLGRGNYYINMYEGYRADNYKPTAKMTITVRDQSEINKTNYCRARAINLKAKTYAYIAQTPLNNYGRWYKISLSKNQQIHVQANGSNSYYFRIYDKNANMVSADGSGTLTTKSTCAKGTYYIYVREVSGFGSSNRLGEYIRFRWY